MAKGLQVAVVLLLPAFVATVHADEPRLCHMTASPPTLVAGMTTEPIAIDGKLAEAAWRKTKASSGFTLVLEANTKAPQQTHVCALHDKDKLYIAMVCDEPNVSGLVKRADTQGKYPSSDDRIEVLIGAPDLPDTYYEFVVSSGNIRFEARSRVRVEPFDFYTTTGVEPSAKSFQESDPDWSADWESAVVEGEGCWTVEIAIPLAKLGINTIEDQVLRANFGRVRVTYMPSPWGRRLRPNIKPDHSAWSSPKGEMGTPALFGYITLADRRGNAPSTPEMVEVAVPGMPGMPGVPRSERPPDRVRFTVKAEGPARKLPRFWDGLGGSRLSPLDPGVLKRTYGKGYCTKVRLDRPWPRNSKLVNGKLEGDMSAVNRIYDTVRDNRMTAIATIWHVPREIEYANPSARRRGGPLKDEKDYRVIYDIYRAYFQYLLDRYGREFFDELRFEFWNEPDWPGKFFGGTVDDYFKWYAWVAKALKDVSPTGRIGGPAVTGGGFSFTREFLQRCRDAENPATGGKGAPVDFVSFHTYGWRAQLTPYASADTILTMGRFWKIMDDTGFAGTETFVSEFGIEPTGAAGGPYYWFRKTHYAPVWLARFVKQTNDATQTYAHMKARIDGILIHLGAAFDSPPFHGKRSLFTEKFVPKPYYNGYVLLNELGGERLQVDGPESQDIACMATRREDGSLAILVFHFREYARTSPEQDDVTVELAGLPVMGARISQMRVDERTSNSHTAWVKMGSPRQITDEIAAKLIAAGEPVRLPVNANGSGVVELNMPVNSVAVLIVEPDSKPRASTSTAQ